MTEWSKTGLLLLVAAVAVLGAWLAKPRALAPDVVVDDSGERFFPAFDPLDATSLEIATVKESSGEPSVFKVAKVDGIWEIPSHDGYPADAKDRLGKVAASIVDIKKGSAVSDTPGDHELYGVIDPAAPGEAASGFGTRVTLENEAGGILVDLIIGKEVKESPGIRYVRLPERDRIYMSAIDTADLSTRFEDWIERDLLQLQANEVAEVIFDDYSIDELNQRLIRGDRMVLKQDDKMQWILEGLDVTKEGLQTAKLNEMRRALDDLRIVDVRRKPAGLSSMLQAQEGEMTLDAEARNSLASRGFFVVGNQLLSNEGETIVRTDDGVEYILRFGEIATFDEGVAGIASEDGSAAEQQPGRYLFVTATFRSELIPEPEYEPLPEMSPGPDEAPLDEVQSGEVSGNEAAEGEGARDAGRDEGSEGPGGPRMTQDEDAAPQDQPPADPNAAAEQETAEAPSLPVDDAASSYEDECQRITEANDANRAEYDQKLADGRKRVEDLNRRFANWYFIVDDKEYRRIRLKRAEFVTPLDAKADNTKERPAPGTSAPATPPPTPQPLQPPAAPPSTPPGATSPKQ